MREGGHALLCPGALLRLCLPGRVSQLCLTPPCNKPEETAGLAASLFPSATSEDGLNSGLGRRPKSRGAFS